MTWRLDASPSPSPILASSPSPSQAPESASISESASGQAPGQASGQEPAPFPAMSGAEQWRLRLYVAGQTPRSLLAFANLRQICEEHLAGRYQIDIIDLQAQPELAREEQILAIPTLVRALPEPVRRIIGDLSHTERVLVGLDLVARA